MPTFAAPAWLSNPDWKPKTTEEVVGPNYQAPEGGPSLEYLNNSPGWQLILGQMAGAPSTIPNSKDLPSLIANVLSGVQSLETSPMPEQMDAAATYIAPMPGQAGWVNPQWAPGALPGDRPPPAPSTNDLGHTFYPSDVSSETGQAFDPWSFGQATQGSWLDKAQQSFPQGKPSAPVVNQWSNTPPEGYTPGTNRYGIPFGFGYQAQPPATGPKREAAANNAPWANAWYS